VIKTKGFSFQEYFTSMMAKEKRRYFSLRRRDEAFAYHQNHFCSRARAEDSGLFTLIDPVAH
jgi:hypothetical protein